MNELVQYDGANTSMTYPPTNPPAQMPLVRWAEEAQAAHQLADALCRTSFAPAAFRGNPGEATAAILAGAEIGLSPLAALRSISIIQGTPAPTALALRAVAQSHGHTLRLVESSDTRAVVKARRAGESDEVTVTWTIERARKLGVTGKDNWQKQPQAMLVARATAEAARLVAADALLGIPYASEELADDEPTAPVRVSRMRPKVVPDVVEPDPTPEVRQLADDMAERSTQVERPVDTVELPPADGVTAKQVQKLAILMKHMDRDAALAYVFDVIGREVTTRNDLTKTEASRVIDALEDEEARFAASTHPVDEPLFDNDPAAS